MSSPTPLTYNNYVTALALLAAAQSTTVGGVVQGQDPNFTAIIPQALNYAELRIQRDADLLAALETNAGYSLTPGNGLLSIPLSDFVTVETLAIASGPSAGPLTLVSKEWIQNVYGPGSAQGPPQYFANAGGDAATNGNTSVSLLLGPPPDLAYAMAVYGVTRLPSLNTNNTAPNAATATTFISAWLPDLLLMASMVFISGYQRNWSAAADDPQMPVNYEAQYQALLKGAQVEEARKKFKASAWTSQSPPVVATAA